MLVNGVLARIPLGHLTFFLKAGKLPAIVNYSKEFPEKQQGKADCDDRTDNTQYDAKNVQNRRAFFGLLYSYEELPLVVVAVNESNAAIIVIVEPALTIGRKLLFNNVHFERNKRAVGTLGFS